MKRGLIVGGRCLMRSFVHEESAETLAKEQKGSVNEKDCD
jgi:hypothetical protein